MINYSGHAYYKGAVGGWVGTQQGLCGMTITMMSKMHQTTSVLFWPLTCVVTISSFNLVR